jgi:hypothetical protein
MKLKTVVTHPGGAHKDEFLACCLLIAAAESKVSIFRKDPQAGDLEDPEIAVVDIGGAHDPAKLIFDHHQFGRDHEPMCALSLVLQYLGRYRSALDYCDWMETAEWLDSRGPIETARWLEVPVEAIFRLTSPIDAALLQLFAGTTEVTPDSPLWEIMRSTGSSLLGYLDSMKARMELLGQIGEFWTIELGDRRTFEVFHVPRHEDIADDPSLGIDRYLILKGQADSEKLIATVYPDRRGNGWAINRFRDHPSLDLSMLAPEPDIRFAHVRGFVAKTESSDTARIKALIAKAIVTPAG